MVNTINPADCDRATVYAGECRNFQDTEWITFNSGRRRSPNARDGNTWLIDVANGSFWMRDDQVRNLVRLAPARPAPVDMVNEWTRDDFTRLDIHPMSTPTTVLDTVAAWLNAHYPKPASDLLSSAAECVLDAEDRAKDAKAEAARWRRAHGLVEQERITARQQFAGAVARAETAERERDEWKQEHDRLVVHGSVRGDTYAAMVRDRDEWRARAEAAEARTAVTREDVEKAVGRWIDNKMWNVTYPRVVDAVWSLLSGDDPAVFVVRESQLPDVERNEDGDWLCEKALVVNGKDTAEDLRGRALPQLKHVAMREAVARAIEAEQAVSPVLVKAEEYAMAVGIDWDRAEPEDVDLLMKVAAHVLGQEANDA